MINSCWPNFTNKDSIILLNIHTFLFDLILYSIVFIGQCTRKGVPIHPRKLQHCHAWIELAGYFICSKIAHINISSKLVVLLRQNSTNHITGFGVLATYFALHSLNKVYWPRTLYSVYKGTPHLWVVI